jgi:hypothetical protein
MSELLMMEAALFQLRAAVGDDPMLLPIRISADVLANAVAAAKNEGVNAARVNDLEFALNDLIAAIDDAGAPDEVFSAIALLQNDTAALRRATALPAELTKSVRELQSKLKERAKAMERSQFRLEGSDAEELPHPPDVLRAAAIPIARQLLAAGFATPSLDSLIGEKSELRYHTINEIVDELDIVLGG